jgi:hypothetical protein
VEVEKLYEEFPEFGTVSIRKSGIYEFKLKRNITSVPTSVLNRSLNTTGEANTTIGESESECDDDDLSEILETSGTDLDDISRSMTNLSLSMTEENIQSHVVGLESKYLNDVRALKKQIADRTSSFFDEIFEFADHFDKGKLIPVPPRIITTTPPKKLRIKGEVMFLPTVPKEEFDWLYEQFEANTKKLFKVQKNRGRGFPPHRCAIYGLSVPKVVSGRHREFGKLMKLSAPSRDNPKILMEVLRIGKLISPPGFSFNTITINHNTCSPRHQDDGNVGKSILVSFGEYTGSRICVETVIKNEDGEMENIQIHHNTKYSPIFFDGSKLWHQNTDDRVGNKYSLVFYSKK